MNLLSLINLWLNKFYQITTKVLPEYFPEYFETEHSLEFKFPLLRNVFISIADVPKLHHPNTRMETKDFHRPPRLTALQICARVWLWLPGAPER
jgi:hypothetical protein